MNIVKGTVSRKNGGFAFTGPFTLKLARRYTGLQESRDVSLGIRPEDIDVAKGAAADAIPVEVSLIEEVGSDTLLSVEIAANVSCKVRVPASTRVREGDRINLKIQSDKAHLFDTDGDRIESPAE